MNEIFDKNITLEELLIDYFIEYIKENNGEKL